MNGSEEKLSNNSSKWSINKSQFQGSPLTKQDILDIYSDVFTWIGKFPGMPYKFQANSSNQGHSMDKKLRICLDPRDLNEALEREPYYT